MPKKGEFKLSEGQVAEVVRMWGDGSSLASIARTLGVGSESVKAAARRSGCVRSRSMSQLLCRSKVAGISRERLEELYQREGLGKSAIGEMFDAKPHSITAYLRAYGIPERTRSEQIRLDLARGRRQIAKGASSPNFGRTRPDYAEHLRNLAANQKGQKLPRVWVERSAAARRRRETRFCGWCGGSITRKVSRFEHERAFCCPVHASYYGGHLRKHGPDAPRPLIVARLLEAAKAHPAHVPHVANLEKWGAEFGAREPEILEAAQQLAGGA